jgi:hypothetical protein
MKTLLNGELRNSGKKQQNRNGFDLGLVPAFLSSTFNNSAAWGSFSNPHREARNEDQFECGTQELRRKTTEQKGIRSGARSRIPEFHIQ